MNQFKKQQREQVKALVNGTHGKRQQTFKITTSSYPNLTPKEVQGAASCMISALKQTGAIQAGSTNLRKDVVYVAFHY